MNNELVQYDRALAAMEAGAKASGLPWEPPSAKERAAIDKLSDQLVELDFSKANAPDSMSAFIQDSLYGYALYQQLLARHHADVQKLAEYGETKIPRHAQHWREERFDRDNPWAAPRQILMVARVPGYIYPLTDSYDLVVAVPPGTGCDVAITEKCSGTDDDNLDMAHGQMLAHWDVCGNCIAWLVAKAQVERESNDDLASKEAHFYEVDATLGKPARDLTRFMRSTDRLPFLAID